MRLFVFIYLFIFPFFFSRENIFLGEMFVEDFVCILVKLGTENAT